MNNLCSQEFKELLPWYVNGTLTDAEHMKVDLHLALCENCQRELDELRVLQAKIVRVVESLAEPSSELFERTVERIRSGERRTIAHMHWQLFALGFTLGVLYERGRVKIEPEIDALGLKLK